MGNYLGPYTEAPGVQTQTVPACRPDVYKSASTYIPQSRQNNGPAPIILHI